MSANIWCWIPALGLLPNSADFMHRVDEFDRRPAKPAAPGIVRYVDDLLKRYPDLSATTEVETPWADGPMIRDANGGFIDFSITWSQYDKVIPFVTSTAQRDGLNCFDPQTSYYYPATGQPHLIAKYATPEPVSDAKAAISKAQRVCALPSEGPGHWHAVLAKDYWHVWFGLGGREGKCAFPDADIARDGRSAVCKMSLCRSE